MGTGVQRQIEMEFYLADTGDAEAMTARAMAVVSEVGAAGGVDMGRCGRVAGDLSGSVVHEPHIVASHAQGQPRFVLKAGHHAAEVVSA